jgi:hypothetical protein
MWQKYRLSNRKRGKNMLKKILLIAGGLFVAAVLYIDVSGKKFNEKIQREVLYMNERSTSMAAQRFTYDQLKGLPEPVQKYFRYALKNGQEYIRMANLKQTGEFKVTDSGHWVPLDAEQYYATESPSYVWHARLRSTPYVWIEARDVYYEGRGITEGKLFSAFPLMFEAGREMELSSLARFLTEAPWYPTTLLPGKHLEWKGIDSFSAKAVIHDAGYSVSAVFVFDDKGEITKVTTHDRYRKIKGKTERLPWTAYYKNYQEHQGMKIPTEVESEWHLQNGALPYAKLKVREIQYQ